MPKVTVSARPAGNGDYLTASVTAMPELLTEDRTVTGYDSAETADGRKKPVALQLPGDTEALGPNAFRGWKDLLTVCFGTVPYRLAAGAFSGCEGLTTVTLAEGVEQIPLECFSGCTKLRSVRLPGTVTGIHMDAFKNCSSLREVSFPRNLKIIELYAFRGCRALEEVILPEGLKELGEDVFSGCTGLKRVHLPETLETIGSCAFLNCTGLEEIVIPSGVRSLPMGVFAGCTGLKRVTLPKTLIRIHPYAFYRCSALAEVKHRNPEIFSRALAHTPFRRSRYPGEPVPDQLPMELLNKISGEICGTVLEVMGYHWLDPDRSYQLFLTAHPGVIEVHARYREEGQEFRDVQFMTTRLEPLPGVQPLLRKTDEELRQAGDFLCQQLELAGHAAEQLLERRMS